MPRNLDRRVEVLYPVENPRLRTRLRDNILMVHLRDTAKARELLPDGSYVRVEPEPGEPALDSQQWMVEHRGIWHGEE
jgi:polyphosphate kinase